MKIIYSNLEIEPAIEHPTDTRSKKKGNKLTLEKYQVIISEIQTQWK